MFIDIHGHSRKHNVFIYGKPSNTRFMGERERKFLISDDRCCSQGCENDGAEELRLRERIFPRMLWRCADNFSFQSCSFKVPKSKESTARVRILCQPTRVD